MKKKHRSAKYEAWVQFRQSQREDKLRAQGKWRLVPTVPPEPILSAQQRKSAQDELAAVLGTWTASHFEHEGACRASVRSSFCLGGYDWQRSDAEAAGLVAGALDAIGAERPIWEAGQPGHALTADYCAWCGSPMDDDADGAIISHRYCSPECAKSSMENRVFKERRSTDRAYMSAVRAVSRFRVPAKPCVCCGKTFHPRQDKPDAKFCSKKCATKMRIERFRHVATCFVCSNPFMGNHPAAKTCSAACHETAVRIRAGKWQPQKFNRIVFEHFIAGASLPPSSRSDGGSPSHAVAA